MNNTIRSLTATAIVVFAANGAYATGYKGDRTNADADANASAGAHSAAEQQQVQGQNTHVNAGGGAGGHGGHGGNGGAGGHGGNVGDIVNQGGSPTAVSGIEGVTIEGGPTSAGADSSSISGVGDTTATGGNVGDTTATGGNVGDTTSLSQGGTGVGEGGRSSSDNSVHIDQGDNRVISSFVNYPDTQSVISCDLRNKTITLNTIFGGISWGSSKVGSLEDIQRCNLSRVVRHLLIPQAQSEDANMAAEARRHLDAIIPGIQFDGVSEAFLDRFTDVLVAGVNVDKATHSSRRSVFTSVLSNNAEISPEIVEYLNSPNMKPDPVITVIMENNDGEQQTVQVPSICDSKVHCGEFTEAVQAARQAALEQKTTAPSP